jgi:hypothetical protein
MKPPLPCPSPLKGEGWVGFLGDMLIQVIGPHR